MNTHLTDPTGIYNIFHTEMAKAEEIKLELGQEYLTPSTHIIKITGKHHHTVPKGLVYISGYDPREEIISFYYSSFLLKDFIKAIKEGTFTLIK